MDPIPLISINAQTKYIAQQSDPTNNRFVFSYTITISNKSQLNYQLLSRHWLIQDANQKIEEVYGEGVIGEQPVIKSGESFTYTSGAILETDMGTMEGKYFMVQSNDSEEDVDDVVDNKNTIEVSVPKFLLSVPRVLH